MNANPSPPVSIFAFNFLCLRCCHMQRYTHTYPLFTTRSYYGSNILILFSLPPPPPQPSPSQQINLGPSSNPSAKPSDFHFLKVIGKGSFGKVLLARHRTDDQFYAVKVLQKKAILKKKEVNARKTSTSAHATRGVSVLTSLTPLLFVLLRRSTSCRRGMCC